MAQAPGKVVEHLSEGVVIVDLDDQLIYWNPAALRMYGFASAAEAVRTLSEAPQMFELATLDGVVIPVEEWPLARVLRGESLSNLELQVRRLSPGWSRVFRYCGSRVQYAGRRPLGFLTVSDVTERKRTRRSSSGSAGSMSPAASSTQAIVRTPEAQCPV